MKKFLFLFALSSVFIFSCNTQAANNNNEHSEKTDTTKTETDKPESKATDNKLEDFFNSFKKAVAAGDKAGIQKLTHFGGLTKEDFDNTYEDFFTDKDAKAQFVKATVADLVPNDSSFEGVTVEDVHQFVISFSTKVDGETFESSLMYFFGKVDGKYRLVYLSAAG